MVTNTLPRAARLDDDAGRQPENTLYVADTLN